MYFLKDLNLQKFRISEILRFQPCGYSEFRNFHMGFIFKKLGICKNKTHMESLCCLLL